MMSKRFVLIALAGLLACASVAHAQSQSWDKVLPAPKRFVVLDPFGGQAVLDKETGLVWARTPLDSNGDGQLNSDDRLSWLDAQVQCGSIEIGNRMGWRLPTVEELGSLVDRSVPFPGPALPQGHPFDVGDGVITFWTGNTYVGDLAIAWAVGLKTGQAEGGFKVSRGNRGWCVRGGQGVDPR